MDPIIWAIILSILPISELRGGMLYATLQGISPLYAFIICVLFNILIIPVIFFFLDNVNHLLMEIKWYNRIFNKYVDHKIGKIKRKYENLTFIILFLFVAIPSPGTGAYTGSLLAWLFMLNRKRSILTISLGVLTAGIIVLLGLLLGRGIIRLF